MALVSRDVEKMEATAAEIRQRGGKPKCSARMWPTKKCTALEQEVSSRLGKVQILINNAGVNVRKPITDFTLDEWNFVLGTNLTAVFLMCRSFVPHMKGTGYGRILNMTSIMSHISLPGRAAYSASKAGLLGMTKASRWNSRPRESRRMASARSVWDGDECRVDAESRDQSAVHVEDSGRAVGQGGRSREAGSVSLLR